MTKEPSANRTGPWSGWLAGLVLGAISGFALLELGVIGLAIASLSLLLIAWTGPRLPATTGLVTGAGGVWTLLFGRVMLSCTPAESCDARGIEQWVAVAAMILAVGLAATVLTWRKSRSR